MKRSLLLYLSDLSNTESISLAGFTSNELIQDAVIRNLEIIGEAAKHIPQSFRDKYPDIPGGQSPVCATSSFMNISE